MRPAFFIVIFFIASFIVFGSLFLGGIDPENDDNNRGNLKSTTTTTTKEEKVKNPTTTNKIPSPVAPSSPSQEGVTKEAVTKISPNTFTLESRFLLSKRYNQDQSDYEKYEKSALDKYKADLARTDLVKFINGVAIEPIDTMIGLGGKRLKRLKLLASEVSKLKRESAAAIVDKNVNADDGQQQPPTRFVWYDLGARVWPKGSTQWFSRFYPNSTNYEAELYDVLDLVHTYPGPGKRPFKTFNFYKKAAWVKNGKVSIGGVKMASVAFENQVLDPKKVTVWESEAVDFAELLKNKYPGAELVRSGMNSNNNNTNKNNRNNHQLGYSGFYSHSNSDPPKARKYFIVIKMDIEGGEWPLMQYLERSGALAYIDELMLECHPPQRASEYSSYNLEEDGGSDAPWKPRKHGEMHPDCIRLINRMRLSGVYCHGWF